MTLVQNKDSEETPIAAGKAVLVQHAGTYTRVIEKPEGLEDQWRNPDAKSGGAGGGGGSGGGVGGTSGAVQRSGGAPGGAIPGAVRHPLPALARRRPHRRAAAAARMDRISNRR